MKKFSVLFVLCLLRIGHKECLASPPAFRFDHDTGGDDCVTNLEDCATDNIFIYKCPIACAKNLQPRVSRTTGQETNPDDEFYSLSFPDINSNQVDLVDMEGYVVLVAAVPNLPGVARFYYDMMDHVHDVYPYTIELF